MFQTAERKFIKRSRLTLRNHFAEALALLLDRLGLTEVAGHLRSQFELHVYAGPRSRGASGEAEAFLAGSSLPQALPEVLRELRERRRCDRAP